MRECSEGILNIIGVFTRKKKILKEKVSLLGKLDSLGKIMCPFRNSLGALGVEVTQILHQVKITSKVLRSFGRKFPRLIEIVTKD